MAAVIPATLATWAGFGLFALGAALLLKQPFLRSVVWLAAILILGPLMAVMSVNFCMMVSSRVNDPRCGMFDRYYPPGAAPRGPDHWFLSSISLAYRSSW
jgi:hypothetical protein